MSILRFILKTFIRIKVAILVILFTLSLALNIVLFMGGYLFSAINSGFEAVTGIQTIASRNKAQIADLSEEVIIERNTKRELKGQLRETSADLTRTRISVRSLENKTQKITDELVTERKAKKELKTQLADTTGNLLTQKTKTQALRSEVGEKVKQLALEKKTNRELKGQLRDFSLGIIPFKGKKVAIKSAVDETADRISKRAAKTAAREVASMPAEAIPTLGVAVIVGITALEINDLCDTIKDMTALKRAFNPDLRTSSDELEVCSIKVPPKEEILSKMKASPKKAWEATKEATPDWEELKQMEFPDISFNEIWDATKEGSSNLFNDTADSANDLGGKLKRWWDGQ